MDNLSEKILEDAKLAQKIGRTPSMQEPKRDKPVKELLADMKRDAKKGCSMCGGRGYTGRNIDTGIFQTCKCVFKTQRIREDALKKFEQNGNIIIGKED